MANRVIEAVLRLSSKLGNVAAFRQLSGHLAAVDNKARAVNRSQLLIARSARGAYAATARLIAPVLTTAAAMGATKNYAAIERRIGRIGSTAEATVEETEVFGRRLRSLANDLRVPFQQVVEGADELAASGKNIEQINKLLPSVSRAAHASGAEFKDMATTADAVTNSLGILETQMERAFDVLAYGGKVGKFELKDMAAQLPSLLPAFAALGYKGEEGLKKIVAMLQGVRMETGQSSEAATAMMDVFTKMESLTVTNNFKKFGVDLRRSLAVARRDGKDVLDVFMDLAVQAVKGDLSKLPQLFTDKQMLIGMRALINQRDQVKAWQADMSNAAGTVATDMERFANDAQASLDTLSNAWDRLTASSGRAIVTMGGTDVMDWVSDRLDRNISLSEHLQKSEMSFLERASWFSRYHKSSKAAQEQMQWGVGYVTDAQREAIDAFGADLARRHIEAAVTPRRPADKAGYPIEGPIPAMRPEPGSAAARDRSAARWSRMSRPPHAFRQGIQPTMPPSTGDAAYDDFLRAAGHAAGQEDAQRRAGARFLYGDAADGKSFREAMKIEIDGSEAGRSIEDAARKVNEAGAEAGSAFSRMLEGVGRQLGEEAARSFRANVGNITVGVGGIRSGVNADLGRAGPAVEGAN